MLGFLWTSEREDKTSCVRNMSKEVRSTSYRFLILSSRSVFTVTCRHQHTHTHTPILPSFLAYASRQKIARKIGVHDNHPGVTGEERVGGAGGGLARCFWGVRVNLCLPMCAFGCLYTRACTYATCAGVLHWKLDADRHESDPALDQIRSDRGYSYQVRPPSDAR